LNAILLVQIVSKQLYRIAHFARRHKEMNGVIIQLSLVQCFVVI